MFKEGERTLRHNNLTWREAWGKPRSRC